MDSSMNFYSDPTRIRVSDRNNQIEFATLTLPGGIAHEDECIASLDISPDASRQLTAGGKEILIWNAVTLANSYYEKRADVNMVVSKQDQPASANTARYSPCGLMIAASLDNGSVLVFHRCAPEASSAGDTMPECWRMQCTAAAHEHSVLDLAWSPSGQYLAVTSVDNTASVWSVPLLPIPNDFHEQLNPSPSFPLGRVDMHMVVRFTHHTSWVTGIAWDPLGQCLASLDASGTQAIWSFTPSPPHSNLLRTVNTQLNLSSASRQMEDTGVVQTSISRLSFSPDGSKLYVSRGLSHSGVENSTAQSIALCIDRMHWTVDCQYAGHTGIITVAAACPQQYRPAKILQQMLENPDNVESIARNNFAEVCYSVPCTARLTTHLPSSRHSTEFTEALPLALKEMANSPESRSVCSQVALGDTAGQISIWSSNASKPLAIFESFFVSAVQDIVWCSSGSSFYACSYSGEVQMFRFGVFELGIHVQHEEIAGTLSHLLQRNSENKYHVGFRLYAQREWYRVMSFMTVYCLDEINRGYEDIDIDTEHNSKFRAALKSESDMEVSFVEFDTREQCTENQSLLACYTYPQFLQPKQQADLFDRRRQSRVERLSIDVSVYPQIDHLKKLSSESKGYSAELGLPAAPLPFAEHKDVAVMTLKAVSKRKRAEAMVDILPPQPLQPNVNTHTTVTTASAIATPTVTISTSNTSTKKQLTPNMVPTVVTPVALVTVPNNSNNSNTSNTSNNTHNTHNTHNTSTHITSTTALAPISTQMIQTVVEQSLSDAQKTLPMSLTNQMSTLVNEEQRLSGLQVLSQTCRQFLQNPVTNNTSISTLETATLLWYQLMPLLCQYETDYSLGTTMYKLTSHQPVRQYSMLVAPAGVPNILTTLQGVTVAKKAYSTVLVSSSDLVHAEFVVPGLPVSISASDAYCTIVTLVPSVSAYSTETDVPNTSYLSSAVQVIQTSQYQVHVLHASSMQPVAPPMVLSVPPHSVQTIENNIVLVTAQGDVCVYSVLSTGLTRLYNCDISHLLVTAPSKVSQVGAGTAKNAVIKAITQVLPEGSVLAVKSRSEQRALFHKLSLTGQTLLLTLTDGRAFYYDTKMCLWGALEEPTVPHAAVTMYNSTKLDGVVCHAQRKTLRAIMKGKQPNVELEERHTFPKATDVNMSMFSSVLTTLAHFERQIMRASILSSVNEYEQFVVHYTTYLRDTVSLMLSNGGQSPEDRLVQLCQHRIDELLQLMSSQGRTGNTALLPPNTDFEYVAFMKHRLLPLLTFDAALLQYTQKYSALPDQPSHNSMLDLDALNISWNIK